MTPRRTLPEQVHGLYNCWRIRTSTWYSEKWSWSNNKQICDICQTLANWAYVIRSWRYFTVFLICTSLSSRHAQNNIDWLPGHLLHAPLCPMWLQCPEPTPHWVSTTPPSRNQALRHYLFIYSNDWRLQKPKNLNFQATMLFINLLSPIFWSPQLVSISTFLVYRIFRTIL